MEKKHKQLDAVISWNLNPTELKFLKAYMEWKGFKIDSVLSNSEIPSLSENDPDKFFLFINPNILRIQEIFDWSLEFIVAGKASQDEKNLFVKNGIARYWDISLGLNLLPLEILNTYNRSLLFWVFTGDSNLDRLIKSILVTYGLRVLVPLAAEHLAQNILQEKPDCIILDWDYFLENDKNFYTNLEKVRSRIGILPPILGIKDFQKPGIANELKYGISKFSFHSLSRPHLIQNLIYSFISKPKKDWKTNQISYFYWDRPIRGYLEKIEIQNSEISTSPNENELSQLQNSLQWLSDPNLFH
ncbi:hypothetical protein [Leptospira sp. GIMC2001]|uniref:hypothetical protein n=1 Tax=Leptospira sp. GIMC2001 TaxID=1513297 RepID=UPI00234A8E6D|nr:hypothetical protein [Leptospira sp. GIMC2001]WCL50559.1 hypothetical protein O4O04_07005 [Leptospira sp. GIMC2001]